jgi:hypothetical protein
MSGSISPLGGRTRPRVDHVDASTRRWSSRHVAPTGPGGPAGSAAGGSATAATYEVVDVHGSRPVPGAAEPEQALPLPQATRSRPPSSSRWAGPTVGDEPHVGDGRSRRAPRSRSGRFVP